MMSLRHPEAACCCGVPPRCPVAPVRGFTGSVELGGVVLGVAAERRSEAAALAAGTRCEGRGLDGSGQERVRQGGVPSFRGKLAGSKLRSHLRGAISPKHCSGSLNSWENGISNPRNIPDLRARRRPARRRQLSRPVYGLHVLELAQPGRSSMTSPAFVGTAPMRRRHSAADACKITPQVTPSELEPCPCADERP